MPRAIKDQVLTVLSQATVEGNVVRLAMQLERKLYEETNKVLEALGGKWNRKAKGHVFADDPTGRLDAAILTGEYVDPKQEFGFFETPAPVVERLLKKARVCPDHLCLEPSAGHGAIAQELAIIVGPQRVVCCELLPENAKVLRSAFPQVCEGDFLTWPFNVKFDRIVMNPPFAKQADIAHVTHAFSLLAPSGVLVSVMAAGVLFREDKRTKAFRQLVNEYGEIEELPEDSFKVSGTGVRTVIVTLER